MSRRVDLPVRVVVFSLLLALLPAGALAQDAPPSADDLRARLTRIEQERGHEAAESALDHARRALRASARAESTGDVGAASRARSIADAALVLADRLAARERAQRAVAEARERKAAAHRRAAAAREALQAALAQREEAPDPRESRPDAPEGDEE